MPPTPFFSGWTQADVFSVVLAGVLAVTVVQARRRSFAPALLGAILVSLMAVVALASTQFDLVGWHGFMHGSPMLRMLDGGPVPPEDPLFAGQALRYPWIDQWLMASIGRACGIAPHVLEIAFETMLFGAFLAAIAALASTVTSETGTVALAVVLGAFGISIFHEGLLRDALLRAFPWLSLETRVVPLDKFASISAMPAGYVAAVASAVASWRLACGDEAVVRRLAVVAVCTLVAAFFHPLSLIGLVLYQGVVVALLLAGIAPIARNITRAVAIVVAVSLPFFVALPYLHSVAASSSSDGWTGITLAPWLLGAKAFDLAIFLTPLAAVAYVSRRRLRAMLDGGNRALLILAASIVVMALAYLVVRFPGRNEYKFLLFASAPGAVLLAIGLRELLDRHFAVGFALLFALLLPGARVLGYRPWFQVVDPCRVDGLYLRSLDADADALFQFIATSTPADSVFLAPDLRIPPLARRSLYVAIEAPWSGRDGWGLLRSQLMQWHVRRKDEEMIRRQRLATAVVTADWTTGAPDRVVAAIKADVPGRPLFAHVRDTAAAARLDGMTGFMLVFRNAAGSVYALGH
ncbi:MAG TPA: hypothetical protein VGK20_14455 [Candidatus Binatia bacterium]|jgi:hypothetical protein